MASPTLTILIQPTHTIKLEIHRIPACGRNNFSRKYLTPSNGLGRYHGRWQLAAKPRIGTIRDSIRRKRDRQRRTSRTDRGRSRKDGDPARRQEAPYESDQRAGRRLSARSDQDGYWGKCAKRARC